MSEHAISVRDVSLEFRLSRSNVGTIKEYAIKSAKGKLKYESLWALDGISFDVAKGEVFGIIGPNGAGKSTLMKILARVLPPTSGRVIVRGMVAPMIELGAGFNNELTGYENIIMYGTLLGRSPQRMRERAYEIAEWAEVSEFIDVPLRSYSSGMLARLAFSIATDIEPDVLVVDEVLSVGDASFKLRSQKRMEELIDRGASVVIVSHTLPTVLEIADRTMWLDHGKCVMLGDTQDVINGYSSTIGGGSQ